MNDQTTDPNAGQSLDAGVVIEVQRERIAELEWQLMLSEARRRQAEAATDPAEG